MIHTPMAKEDTRKPSEVWGPLYDPATGRKVPWVVRASEVALERENSLQVAAFRPAFQAWAKEHWPEALRA